MHVADKETKTKIAKSILRGLYVFRIGSLLIVLLGDDGEEDGEEELEGVGVRGGCFYLFEILFQLRSLVTFSAIGRHCGRY